MLLGSALANMGACANVVIVHSVAGVGAGATGVGEAVRIVGYGVGVGVGVGDGVGDGDGFRPYLLPVVVRLRFGFPAVPAEIQVLCGVALGLAFGLALFP